MKGCLPSSVRRLVALGSVLLLLGAAVPALAEGATTNPSPTNANPIVKKIVVEGNKKVSTADIEAQIKSTKVGQSASEQNVRSDLESIASLGYFYDVRARFVEASGGVAVVFTVVENPPIKKITIDGAGVLPGDELVPEIGLKEGDLLNTVTLRNGLQAMLKKAYEGYGILARVKDFSITQDGVVNIVLSPARVGKITITGNNKTKDFVIRREITALKTGDVFNVNKLKEDLRSILNLGFFDEVTPQFKDTDDPDIVDIVIDVKERKTGQAGLGAGYSSADGLIGYIDYSEDNFLGRGQKVGVRWEFGKTKSTYDLSFYEPYLDARHTSIGANVYKRSTEQEYKLESGDTLKYDEKSLGGVLSLGRSLAKDLKGAIQLKAENVQNTAKDPTVTLPPDLAGGNIRSVTFSLTHDTRDFILQPTSGGKEEVSAEIADKVFSGDFAFQKYQGDFTRYLKAGDKGSVLAFRLQSGLINGTAPSNADFRVGGSESVRGYKYGEYTGQKMLVMNTEFRFPVVKSLQGVLFADFGRAWKRDEAVSLNDLAPAIGVGVRIDVPVIGVMRIDYGVGRNGGKAYFSLGQMF